MTLYQIRAADLGDINAIASIAIQSWTHTYGSIYEQTVIQQFVSRAYSYDRLTGSIERDGRRAHRLFHVAVDSERDVIAFSHVVPYPSSNSSFELTRIYALPHSHGTGVGTALLNNIIETVLNLKELSAWVEQRNTIGRRFYERHNFLVVGEKEDDFLGYKTTLLKYVLLVQRC